MQFRLGLSRGAGKEVVVVSHILHLGDIVACEPVVREVRKKHPKSYLVFCVARAYKELADSHPAVDYTLAVNCVTEWIWLRKLNIFKYTVDLNVDKRCCPVCGIPLLKTSGDRSVTVENYFDNGNLLEAHCRWGEISCLSDGPRVYISGKVRAAVDNLCLPDKYVAIHCKSNEEVKDYPASQWKTLIEQINFLMGMSVVEVGLEAVAVQPSMSTNVCLCGRLSILETAEVIKRSCLFVGVDSGPAHLANAVGARGVILMGRYRRFARYMPYSGSYADGSSAELLFVDGPVANLSSSQVYDAVKRQVNRVDRSTKQERGENWN